MFVCHPKYDVRSLCVSEISLERGVRLSSNSQENLLNAHIMNAIENERWL